MKKIKIIEGMDLMRDDIRSAFENNYIGINNSYDNKVMFVAAINQYFDGLVREGVLYGDAENTADIDVNAQRDWLAQKYDISEYSDEQIRKAKTGSYVFVTADVTFCDSIEIFYKYGVREAVNNGRRKKASRCRKSNQRYARLFLVEQQYLL